mmetsp:Transcript_10653/g.33687  ORF Transcript_10653/g.33687 Transcript_10653/m.33687 type:complete len:231 (-) Transcript_10653:42-734(-)
MVAEDVLQHQLLILLGTRVLVELLHLLEGRQSILQRPLLGLDVGGQIQRRGLSLLVPGLLEERQGVLGHFRRIVHGLGQHRRVDAWGHVVDGGHPLHSLGNGCCGRPDAALEAQHCRLGAEHRSGHDLVAQVRLHQREHGGLFGASASGLSHGQRCLGLLNGQLRLPRDEVRTREHAQHGDFLLTGILQQLCCLLCLVQCCSELGLCKGALRSLPEVNAFLQVLGRHACP